MNSEAAPLSLSLSLSLPLAHFFIDFSLRLNYQNILSARGLNVLSFVLGFCSSSTYSSSTPQVSSALHYFRFYQIGMRRLSFRKPKIHSGVVLISETRQLRASFAVLLYRAQGELFPRTFEDKNALSRATKTKLQEIESTRENNTEVFVRYFHTVFQTEFHRTPNSKLLPPLLLDVSSHCTTRCSIHMDLSIKIDVPLRTLQYKTQA